MVFISPAQGAMFAPLALRFVQASRPFFFIPDKDSRSVPIRTIIVPNKTKNETNLPSQRIQDKNVGAVVGGVIGGVAAVFAVIGIVTFVQRRHRRKPGARAVTARSQFSSSPSLLPIMTG